GFGAQQIRQRKNPRRECPEGARFRRTMNFSKSARPVIMGRNGMVAAGHSLGALAGVKVLQEGGNAVDAALAAGFVMAVVKPESCGPGGALLSLGFMEKNREGPARIFRRPWANEDRVTSLRRC